MKFILAPDSFKESMTAKAAALAMKKGIEKVFPDADCVIVPMADGGEGTVDSLIEARQGTRISVEVCGPLGEKVVAEYGLIGKTAVIEMASASGLQLISREQRNPLFTTTFGTGEVIKHALDLGVERMLIGIGGSATNDGGVGMLQALGVSFKNKEGKELAFGGGSLGELESMDLSGLDPRLETIQIDVACDVTNPLTGEKGASAVFGPQKGATPEMVKELDDYLAHYGRIIEKTFGTDYASMPGAGAAGGLGVALMAFLQANVKSGIELVIEYTGLEEKLKDASYVFTGEGGIDQQTLLGKTPFGVAQVARKRDIPVIAFAGRVGNSVDELYEHGFTAIFGILPSAMTLEEALQSGEENLRQCVENVCRLLR